MAKKILKKGLFITFEGVEGCGKSTHSRAIYDFLKKRGLDVVFIREPGGTRIGEKIRKILLAPKNNEMSDAAELFLFEANRSQIVKEIIKPALKARKIVICDRFFDSTTAYQGYANKMDIKFIEKINKFASGGIEPDLTIVLDIMPKIGLEKIGPLHIKDRMERKLLSFHNRVRAGYKSLAKRHKKRIKIIKIHKCLHKTQERVWKQVLRYLKI